MPENGCSEPDQEIRHGSNRQSRPKNPSPNQREESSSVSPRPERTGVPPDLQVPGGQGIFQEPSSSWPEGHGPLFETVPGQIRPEPDRERVYRRGPPTGGIPFPFRFRSPLLHRPQPYHALQSGLLRML